MQLGLDGMDTEDSWADFSPCGNWRYTLYRQWEDGPCVGWMCYNPSTANAVDNDHSVRKMIQFSKNWGYGSMVLLNLFAIKGTDPRTPSRVSDPVGPMNDYWIVRASEGGTELIAAWGCGGHMKGELAKRPARVMQLMEDHRFSMPIRCLGYSADGSPRHPLMLKYETQREDYRVKHG